MNREESSGALMIIGGGEDRTDTMTVLQTFISLAGGPDQPIVILSAASTVPEKVCDMYQHAFNDLGATSVAYIHTSSRDEADDPELVRQVTEARGIFMTGGDQKRLVSMLGGTGMEKAMRDAYSKRGACIAGTSAGASGLCTHMLAEGRADLAPEKGAVRLGAGLGFVSRVVIDQHFSQRHRINRLLTVVAQSPFLLGAGIDEDTALIVHGDRAIEVVGEGNVTVVDCRTARSNMLDLAPGQVPEMIDVRIHVLPSGSAYALDPGDADACQADKVQAAPPPVAEFIQYLTNWNLES